MRVPWSGRSVVLALRSAAAAPVLIVTGFVTFAVRLPGVWIIADAPAPEELRDRPPPSSPPPRW